MLNLFNTFSRQIEEFKPIHPPQVGFYACGITAYDYAHIGNLRRYIMDDVIRRTLLADGYEVKYVENVTDVGHLSSDADEGDDKLEKGAREHNQTVWEVAKFFENYFFSSLDQVNVLQPSITCRATEHINEQIKLIEKLEKNGFTYQTPQAIYFDVSKFPDYTKLSHQKLEEKKTAVRDEVVSDPEKRNPQDFALWFFTVGHFENHTMHWSSPWGEGFPGWHIECSAMSMEYLGNHFDIHSGGVDHIPVHHTNEIAQAEAATGEKFVNYWIHHEFLLVDGLKMSKSKKNFYNIDDIKNRGFDPLALRYLFLTAHYREQMNFTWEALESAQNALDNLRQEVRGWDEPGGIDKGYEQKFRTALNEDINTAKALAALWEMIKSDLPSSSKSAIILQMDEVLGLGLADYVANPLEIPSEVKKLVEERENARKKKDFKRSDELRDGIKKLGYEVEDTPEGPKLKNI